jgi:hypothetical protein
LDGGRKMRRGGVRIKSALLEGLRSATSRTADNTKYLLKTGNLRAAGGATKVAAQDAPY